MVNASNLLYSQRVCSFADVNYQVHNSKFFVPMFEVCALLYDMISRASLAFPKMLNTVAAIWNGVKPASTN